MLLPDNTPVVRSHTEGAKILLYGDPMIGKTTLASKFPDPIIISTDNNIKGITTPAVILKATGNPVIGGKSDGLTYLRALIKELSGPNGSKFKTVIIDLVDDVLELIETAICEEYRVKYIGDIPHGKGWSLAGSAFRMIVRELSATGKDVILISKSTLTEAEEPSGKKYSKYMPKIREKILKDISSYLDYVWYAHVTNVIKDGKSTEVRALQLHPSQDTAVAFRNTAPKQAKVELDYDKLKGVL